MDQVVKNKTIKEAKRIEEDSLYSAKGHFCAAGPWEKCHLCLGSVSAILAGISGVSALSQFDYNNIIAGILALIVAALTAISTFLNPDGRASLHHTAGNQYNSLRNKARIFHKIRANSITVDADILNELKYLDNRRNELNEKSPQIPRWAFEKARKGIEEGEADYKIDK